MDFPAADLRHVARQLITLTFERLEEKKLISEDIGEVYSEAKSMGFDAKVMRQVVKMRKQNTNESADQVTVLDTYLAALGMLTSDAETA